MRYRPGINQYTEKEMKKRVKKLWFPLLYRGGFDILLTHSPAYQLNDGLDLPHQGFQVFNTLMDKYHQDSLFTGMYICLMGGIRNATISIIRLM